MRSSTISLAIIVVAIALPAAARCDAAQRQSAISAKQVLDDLRSGDHGRVARGRGTAIAAFTRREEPPSAAVLDSLAEGLEELATVQVDEGVAAEAVAILGIAGSPEASSPRPDALERLIRIYDTSPSVPVQSAVLSQTVFLADAVQAMEFAQDRLAKTDDDAVATTAIKAISMNGGERAKAMLAALQARGDVRSVAARRLLSSLARTGFVIRR